MFNSEPILIDSIPDHVKALVQSPLPLSVLPGGGMWMVNLANGHAYKCIRCKSWDDANDQAVTEQAHLVSINDATEQKWLLEIFGPLPYWIGLTDSTKEGEWQWTSGGTCHLHQLGTPMNRWMPTGAMRTMSSWDFRCMGRGLTLGRIATHGNSTE